MSVAVALGSVGPARGEPAAPSGEPPADLRFGPADAAVVEQRGSDLRIMGRVLERAVRPAGRENAVGFRMGIPLWVSAGEEGVRSTFLEGFGALFTLKVDVPLVPPRSKAATTNASPAASDWDAARREVQGDPADPGFPEPTVAYDARLVDQVREQLVSALRLATNIRHLGAGEFVAVVVEGPAPDAGDGGTGNAVGPGGGGLGGVAVGGDAYTSSTGAAGGSAVFLGSGSGSGGGRGSFRWSAGRSGSGWSPPGAGMPGFHGAEGFSRLALRVRKADLEALAAGTLSGEAWAKAVSVHAYSGIGAVSALRSTTPF